MITEQDEVNLIIAQAFDDLGVPYYVGGSLASSTHGIYRATNDSDFIAELIPSMADDFVARLADRFYADLEVIRDAVTRYSSFNIIHPKSWFQVPGFTIQVF